MAKKHFAVSLISILIFALLGAGFLVYQLRQAGEVAAGAGDNVTGWAWAGVPQASGELLGLGWISFNGTNEPGGADYGVNIEDAVGNIANLTGYAYFDINDPDTGTDELGWIDFNASGPYPVCPGSTCPGGSPDYSARLNVSSKKVTGWARALNYDGGWDGWILLGPIEKGGTDYGVYIDDSVSPAEFRGWAWGSDVVGWILFNCKDDPNPNTCNNTKTTGTGTPLDEGFKVWTSFAFVSPPEASDLQKDSETYCSVAAACTGQKQKGDIALSWLYDGDVNQEEYKLAIATNPGFGGAKEIIRTQTVLPGERGSAGVDVVPSPSPTEPEIGYNDDYWFRVKVKDTNNTWSDWSNIISISTPLHAYPWVCFSYDPTEPVEDEVVTFTDESEVYGGSSKSSIFWQFEDGDPATANGSVATTTFSSGENKLIQLTITDSTGYQCTGQTQIDINLPMPGWTEE